jgi:hypothetical protein
MRQAPGALENRKDFQRVKISRRFLRNGVVVCPSIFKLVCELLNGRNTLCSNHQKSYCCCGQSTD